MNLKQELGKNIKKYRKLNNITQERLAETVNIEINSISSIETGKFFPSPDNLVKIANTLNVSLSDLFDFRNDFTCNDYIDEINKNISFIKEDKTKLSAINSFIKELL